MIIDWHEALMAEVFSVVKRLHLDKIFHYQLSFSTYSFTDYFKGFQNVEAVKRIFGEKTDEVLRNLRVEFTPLGGFMWVMARMGILWLIPTT